MENVFWFALVSTWLNLAGQIPYAIGVYKKEVLPHPFSFWVWTLMVAINFWSLLLAHAGWALLPAAVSLFFLVIWTLTGVRVWKKIESDLSDYIFLLCTFMALGVWFFNERYGIILSIVIDIFAFLPSFKKVWLQPFSESLVSWGIVVFYPVFLFASLSIYTFETMAFWIYTFIINSIFFGFIFFRQKFFR